MDLYDVQTEISAISTLITGFGNQFEGGGSRLTDENIQLSLLGIACHLDRIVEDLREIEERHLKEHKSSMECLKRQ